MGVVYLPCLQLAKAKPTGRQSGLKTRCVLMRREYTGQDFTMVEYQAPATTRNSGDGNPGPRAARRVLLFVVLSATFVVYIGTLGFDFVYDDHEQIVENFRIQSWQYAPGYFTQHVWSHISPKDPSNFYRPIFLLWLRLNHMFFGQSPTWWHLTTVLAHLLVTLLVYLLACRLMRDRVDACVAALIFGLHPAHLEAVAWVSGVTEPLLALWFISSFLCYLKWRERSPKAPRWIAASLAFYTLAVLTKETALALPALVLAWEWIFPAGIAEAARSQIQKVLCAIASTVPFLALSVVYLAVRVRVLKELSHAFTPLPLRTLVLTAPSVVWFYLRHLLWPVGFSAFYDQPYVRSLGFFSFVLPVLMLTAVVLGLAWWSRQSRAVAFASIWLFLPILLVLNLRVFAEGDIVHDRYLYLPSVGFSVIAAVALHRLKLGRTRLLDRPAGQVASVATLALALGFSGVSQSAHWANDLLLAYRGMRIAPNSIYALNELAITMAQRGYNDEAIRFYRKVIELRPNFWESHYNLGLLYYQAGKLEEAERYLNAAIEINPFDPREYVCLGFTELQRGRAAEAAALMRRAREIQPDGASSYMALGVVLKSQGDLEGALKEFQTALSKEPGRTSAREQIAELEADIKRSHAPSH